LGDIIVFVLTMLWTEIRDGRRREPGKTDLSETDLSYAALRETNLS